MSEHDIHEPMHTNEHANDYVLEVEGVTKQFPGVLANDDVTLRLRRGEILALLGENGAGKSTLMNIIYGLYRPDNGTIRLKDQAVHFNSPREAIHSGIGMVHQHFQLVNVMSVAENVVLGEEAGVAYQGRPDSILGKVMQWMPSIVIFLLSVLTGVALGKPEYLVGSVVAGGALAVMVARPAIARLVWGVLWRVALAFILVWLAARVELLTRVAITDVALRLEVETVKTKKPQELEGYGVNVTIVEQAPIDFKWSREGRDAQDAGTGTVGLMDSARAQLEEYRDDGVPGWLLDGIDDVPPVTHMLSALLLLVAMGWHSIALWRAEYELPRSFRQADLIALVGLIALYVAVLWLQVDASSEVLLAMSAALLAALAYRLWREYRHRNASGPVFIDTVSPLDGIVDAALIALQNVTQVRNINAAAERVRDLSRRYGLEVDPDAMIEKLPVGMQQRVEIIKALYREADILILDEPTAVLTPQEGQELFKIMRELSAQGVSIIFITHKLKEVFEVATNIVVMRGGRVVGTTTPDQATETSLATMMVGREVILQVEKEKAQPKESVLEVKALQAYNDRGALALNDVSFDVRAGEVLGIAGVQGNGQTELVEVLTGLRESTGGSVKLLGSALQPDVQPEGRIGARIGALLLDTVIVGILAFLFGSVVFYFGETTFETASLGAKILTWVVVALIVDGLYTYGSWRSTGATLGMSQFALHIVDQHDHKPAALDLLKRYLLFVVLRVPALIPALVSLVQAGRSNPERTWFDKLLGLRVIRLEHITPRRIKDTGTSHVPEDRQRHGLVKAYSVADNLVLNDYYERPYAQEPNSAELPLTLVSYLVVAGAILAMLTVLGALVWDEWLWSALLDFYHVPEALREGGDSISGAARDAQQYPQIVGLFIMLFAELILGFVAHTIALRLLTLVAVRRALAAINLSLQHAVWRLRGADGNPPEVRGGLLRDAAAIDRHARKLIEQFDIRTPGPDTQGGNLSGGNQQKMIVAREFSRHPRLLIAAQPTRGIDVGSIEFIHNQIIEQRDEGAAVLLVSAELDEIMGLSDRIAVLYKGEIIDTLPAESASREQLGLLMAGIHN